MLNYACPACGKPDSSNGEAFCGECEKGYQEEIARQDGFEIARLQQEVADHGCTDDCPVCNAKITQIRFLRR